MQKFDKNMWRILTDLVQRGKAMMEYSHKVRFLVNQVTLRVTKYGIRRPSIYQHMELGFLGSYYIYFYFSQS